jgi:hypothetical protein
VARRTTSKTSTTKRTTTPRKPRSTTETPESADVVDAEVVSSTEAADTDTTPPAAEPIEAPSAAGDNATPGAEQATKSDDAATAAAETTEPEPDTPTESGGEASGSITDTPIDPEASDVPDAKETRIPDASDDSEIRPAVESPTADQQAANPSPSPQKSGGFLPMLLGGAVAAGLGYGAHYLQTTQPPAPDAELTALQSEIAELRAMVAQGPDLSALEAQIAALEPSAAPDLSAVDAALDDLRGQIAALPEPVAAPEVDLGPLEQGLAALQSAYAPLPEQIAGLQAEMADLRALATAEIEQAEAAVDSALAQSGLDRIAAALVTGAPFAEATAQLRDAGVALPDPVAESAAQGVQTLEALQESFGDAARAAISASLQTAPADSTTEKLGNFFRAQIGARSLAPREGDDPDAVTSRAGAALEAGDLAAALGELSALPEDGRAAMVDWLNAAQTRLDVEAALDTLQADLTTR